MDGFNWNAYGRWENQKIADAFQECECGEEDCVCEALELRAQEYKDQEAEWKEDA